MKLLWQHITHHRRVQLGMLFILLVIASFSEIFTIGAVLPFLGVIADPEQVFNNTELKPFIQLLGLTEAGQLLFPVTILFIVAALFSGVMRLLFLWASVRLNFAIGTDLSRDLYRRTLYQPYEVQINRNTSEIISVIMEKVHHVIYDTTYPIITLFSSGIMFLFIVLVLVIVDPIIAASSLLVVGLIYSLVIRLTRDRLLYNGKVISQVSPKVVKYVQESIGGIRDVIIDNNQDACIKEFHHADRRKRYVEGNSVFIRHAPRFGIESIGISLIAVVAFYLVQKSDSNIVIVFPTLGALAIGAQRLLPIVQAAYSSWSQLQASKASLVDVLEYLNQHIQSNICQLGVNPLAFNRDIVLNGISYTYLPKFHLVLNNVKLTIEKGDRIGIIGETGSGKSTLLDIIMGLLQPSEGKIEIDGISIDSSNVCNWRKNIAHVPQSIFLADGSIIENIAIGIPSEKIDQSRVRQAAKLAHISSTIENLDNQYDTVIGENGIRLSGGQRQRIGIARALYKKADIIVFDEATSALDNETETKVMEAINGLSNDLTVIIISHRLTTLRNCTKIFELDEGKISCERSYQEIVED